MMGTVTACGALLRRQRKVAIGEDRIETAEPLGRRCWRIWRRRSPFYGVQVISILYAGEIMREGLDMHLWSFKCSLDLCEAVMVEYFFHLN